MNYTKKAGGFTIPGEAGYEELTLKFASKWKALEAIDYWQVFDRTSNCEIPAAQWRYDPVTGNVTIDNITPWHKYSVSFLAYRIWEEIYITDNPYTEGAYYQESGKLVVINNSDREQVTTITTDNSTLTVTIDAYDTKIAAI